MPDFTWNGTQLLKPPWVTLPAQHRSLWWERWGGTLHVRRRCCLPHCAFCTKVFLTLLTRVSLYQAPECRASRSQEGCDSLSGESQEAELEAKLELLSLNWTMLGQEEGNKTTEVQRQMYELEEVRHKSWGGVETRGSSKDRSSMECYQMVSI